MDREKVLRDFFNIDYIDQMIRFGKIDPSKVEEIVRKASSLEDLAQRIASESDHFIYDIGIEHWRDDPDILEDINKARSLLGESPLKYENEKKKKKRKGM